MLPIPRPGHALGQGAGQKKNPVESLLYYSRAMWASLIFLYGAAQDLFDLYAYDLLIFERPGKDDLLIHHDDGKIEKRVSESFRHPEILVIGELAGNGDLLLHRHASGNRVDLFFQRRTPGTVRFTKDLDLDDETCHDQLRLLCPSA